jgi:hypothetical protein
MENITEYFENIVKDIKKASNRKWFRLLERRAHARYKEYQDSYFSASIKAKAAKGYKKVKDAIKKAESYLK